MTQCWLTSQSQKPLSTARSSPANSKKTGKFQESFWLHLVGWIFPRQIHVEVRSYVTPTHWNTRLELHLGKHLYFGTPQQETFAKSKALNMVPKLSNMLTLAFFRKPHPLPKELRNRYRYTHVSIHIYIICIYIYVYIYIYIYVYLCVYEHACILPIRNSTTSWGLVGPEECRATATAGECIQPILPKTIHVSIFHHRT